MKALWSIILLVAVVAVAITALKIVLMILAIPFLILKSPVIWIILLVLGIIWFMNTKEKKE